MWTNVLSGVKNVFDLLFKLIEHRNEKNQKLFENQIEPVFQQLLTIHENYIAVVAEMIHLIKDYTVDTDTIRDTLIERKRNFEHIRSFVSVFAEELRSSPKTSVASNFAHEVVRYFAFSAGTINERVGRTWIKGLIGLTEEIIDGNISREECLWEIKIIEESLQNGWRSMSSEYAKLKVECLGGI